MKKLFVSCPMRGRGVEEIKASIEKMHRIAEAVFGEELETIPSFVPENEGANAVDCLGKSIQLMGMADYFIGISWKDVGEWSGCFIENNVANRYEIPMYLVSLRVAMVEY